MKNKRTIKIFPERWSSVHISVIALFLAVSFISFGVYFDSDIVFNTLYYIAILPFGVAEVFIDFPATDPQALPSYDAFFILQVLTLGIIYYGICLAITAMVLRPKKYIPAAFLVLYAICSIIADYFFGYLF